MLPQNDSTTTLREKYLSAQLAGSRREALRLWVEEGLPRGVPLRVLHLEVLQQAQYEPGRLWQENVISVAQEHLARLLREVRPDLLALSVTMTSHLPQLREAVKHAREALPGLPWAGSPSAGPRTWSWTPWASASSAGTRALVATACRTLGV